MELTFAERGVEIPRRRMVVATGAWDRPRLMAHLREAAVTRMPAVSRDGMCGHLLTYPTDLPGLSRPPDPPEDPDRT